MSLSKPFGSAIEEASKMDDFSLQASIHRIQKFVNQAIDLKEWQDAKDGMGLLVVLIKEERTRV